MRDEVLPEWWQRGPVDGIVADLQPAAHALLQARDEINKALYDFPDERLWVRVAEMASVGFHLQHIKGVLDRLFTYARGEALSPEQLKYLKDEGNKQPVTCQNLIAAMNQQIDAALAYLKTLPTGSATVFRTIGRKQLPTTQMGLIFHAAEHTMRHTGQLLVTAKVAVQG